MATYRKKVDVEAVRWMGTKESLEECQKFIGREVDVAGGCIVLNWDYVPRGFYIIKEYDESGFYMCDPRIFHAIYEEVE